jgi:hypothetical protein
LTRKKLKQWIDVYCQFKGYEVEHGKSHLGVYFEIVDKTKPKRNDITTEPIEDGLIF